MGKVNQLAITSITTKYKMNTTTPEYSGYGFCEWEKPLILDCLNALNPPYAAPLTMGDIDRWNIDPTGTGYGRYDVLCDSDAQCAQVFLEMLEDAETVKPVLMKMAAEGLESLTDAERQLVYDKVFPVDRLGLELRKRSRRHIDGRKDVDSKPIRQQLGARFGRDEIKL